MKLNIMHPAPTIDNMAETRTTILRTRIFVDIVDIGVITALIKEPIPTIWLTVQTILL